MATTYGRSPGGYLWAVLEPVAGIALLAIVFSAAFRQPPLGISFAMFYATGMLPFMTFTDIQNKVAGSLTFSRPLLAYPTVTFFDSLLARFLLNLLAKILVSFLVLTGIVILFETRSTPNLPGIFEAFGLTALLALGIGTLNSYLFTRFPIAQQMWSILMRPMFILSGVIFLFDSVPRAYQGLLWYNPLVHVIGLTRRALYSTYEAEYASPIFVLLSALIPLVIGLSLLKRHHRDLLSL